MSNFTTGSDVLATDVRGGAASPPTSDPAVAWTPEVRRALRDYVSHPLFRAATYDEVVIDDNPFRRPVRPDDLEWLEFAEPVDGSRFACLSALLGHRMLRNVLDAGKPGSLAPRTWTEQTRSDAEQFHSPTNQAAGERVRAFLEQHLFGFLAGAPPIATEGSSADAEDELRHLSRRRAESARAWAGQVAELGRDARRMMVVQLLAPALVARGAAMSSAVAAVLDAVEATAERLGLSTTPHSYWQHYLPTTLALANQLDRDPSGSAARRAGVLTAYAVDARQRLAVLDDVPDALPDVGAEHGEMESATDPEFLRGLRETAALLSVVDTDLTRQLELIGGVESNRLKARHLYEGIQRDRVPVDLDTFVESWEECSTTHVHDDDRLVVIETGEMVFWTCLGQEIRLHEGDMTFVPVHRLHGSVVLSGTCTYHQPIITDELARRYA